MCGVGRIVQARPHLDTPGKKNMHDIFTRDPFDLEKVNFLAWIKQATTEDLRRARENNAEKFDELVSKYSKELEFVEYKPRMYANER